VLALIAVNGMKNLPLITLCLKAKEGRTLQNGTMFLHAYPATLIREACQFSNGGGLNGSGHHKERRFY
jgi:histidine ammonia-lyase